MARNLRERGHRRRIPHARAAAFAAAMGALFGMLLAAGPLAWPAASAAAPPPSPGWLWPVGGGTASGGTGPAGAGGPRVLEPFDPPPERWLAGHRGADLQAPGGGEVFAPAAGVVAFSGTVVDRPVVTINHGDGLVSSFEPVAALVEVGSAVSAGEPIGSVEAGGHCSGRCVHWGLRLNGDYIDPLNTVLDRRPSVLLPLPSGG
jgi:murein DD-endopeptidase MepM/ murein hydrolase activator NlpD